MTEKPREQVRLALDTIRATLAPLTEADRLAVLDALELQNANALSQMAKQLDESRETAESWKRHNDQRIEEVYAARELLKAAPNETLPMAIERRLKEVSEPGDVHERLYQAEEAVRRHFESEDLK